MAFVPVTNVAEVDMIYTVLGENCENVFHVLSDTGWDTTKLTNLCTLFQNWESTNGASARHNSTAFIKVVARDLTTATSGRVEQAPTSPISGTGSTTPAPNNVTIAIKHITGLAGRSFRGRTFWIGLGDDMVSGNNITSGNRTAILTRMGTLLTNVNAVSGQHLVVVSKFHNGAARSPGIA